MNPMNPIVDIVRILSPFVPGALICAWSALVVCLVLRFVLGERR